MRNALFGTAIAVRKEKGALALMAGLMLAAVVSAAMLMGAAIPAYADTVDWNSNVTVLAVGANDDNPATEAGQRIDVTMTFASDVSSVSASDAEAYLQSNITLADRSLNSATYSRDVYDVVVSGNVISFKIDANTAGMTANYNGKLNIAANEEDNATICDAMGGASVETLVGTGVAIANNDGVLAADSKSKTFTITDKAYNRGMVHVLIKDGNNAIFQGTGTFSNGGITVHAHTFVTQTVADFASLICSTATTTATSANLSYTFTAGENGSFTIANGGADCSNIKVYIYDGAYLNTIHGAVGDISEPEMTNP